MKYSTLKILHCIIIFLLVSSATSAQIRIESMVNISNNKKKCVLSLLEDVHNHSGKCFNLNIEKAFLADFVEIADYGPMWYGDSIIVNQNGILVTYEFEKIDTVADKSKMPYRSNDWYSRHRVFIPNDYSAMYEMYICRFGGIPPSHGFANRRKNLNERFEKTIKLLKLDKE